MAFDSVPTGATIRSYSTVIGTTPFTIGLDPHPSYRFSAHMEGYKSVAVRYTRATLPKSRRIVFRLEKLQPSAPPQQQQQQQQQMQNVIINSASAPAQAPPQTGAVTIDSTPEGASVRIGGALVGTTPCTLALPAGVHVLLVAAPGHRDVQETINVFAGGNQTIRISLEAGDTR